MTTIDDLWNGSVAQQKHRAIPQKTAVFSPASEWHGRRYDLVNAILLGQAVTGFSIVYALTPTNIIRRLLFWNHTENIDNFWIDW